MTAKETPIAQPLAFEIACATPTPAFVRNEGTVESDANLPLPKGFVAAGIHSGIKRVNKDLMLIVSELPAVGAGVFTTNIVRAAPVNISERHIKNSGTIRAIVCNSGNANACTGEQGEIDAMHMAEATAKHFNLSAEEVIVSSTGVIGQNLPIEKIVTGVAAAKEKLCQTGSTDAARAIMTTDTFPKAYSVDVELVSGKTVKIWGIAKGSGMICPNMATMLAFVTTDVQIEQSVLQEALREANTYSFNCITVDGDTSTNDMVIVMANGASGAEQIEIASENYQRFQAGLQHVLTVLSKLIVLDGEGATKFIEITIDGAATEEDAFKAARTVANSNLFKTAINGEDANWGRIIAAMGRSGASFNPGLVEISFNGLPILKPNYQVVFSEDAAKKALEPRVINVGIRVGEGSGSATVWTCDFSEVYVHINGSYRS